jgi:hypothetical protein
VPRPLASFPTLKLASTELGRVFTECKLKLDGKITLDKRTELKPSVIGKPKGKPTTTYEITNHGLNKKEEEMVRKILKNGKFNGK